MPDDAFKIIVSVVGLLIGLGTLLIAFLALRTRSAVAAVGAKTDIVHVYVNKRSDEQEAKIASLLLQNAEKDRTIAELKQIAALAAQGARLDVKEPHNRRRGDKR